MGFLGLEPLESFGDRYRRHLEELERKFGKPNVDEARELFTNALGEVSEKEAAAAVLQVLADAMDEWEQSEIDGPIQDAYKLLNSKLPPEYRKPY